MKLYISQSMRDKPEEYIKRDRERAVSRAIDILGCGVDVIESYNKDFLNKNPLEALGESLQMLSQAEAVFFVDGWKKSRGCKIEHECAKKYLEAIIIEEKNDETVVIYPNVAILV